MSCGLPPTPELNLKPPGSPDLNLPRVPAATDLSWTAGDFPGLGLGIDPKAPQIPVPGAPDLNIPPVPQAPDASWAMDDFGIKVPSGAAAIPVPSLPDGRLPVAPTFDDVPCPFDEET